MALAQMLQTVHFLKQCWLPGAFLLLFLGTQSSNWGGPQLPTLRLRGQAEAAVQHQKLDETERQLLARRSSWDQTVAPEQVYQCPAFDPPMAEHGGHQLRLHHHHLHGSKLCDFQNTLNDTHFMLYHGGMEEPAKYAPAVQGNLSRMQKLLAKLHGGQPTSVSIVGASVSTAYCLNTTIGCWVTPVADWLEAQGSHIRVSNNAVGGTTSETAARCFGALIEAEADLVFLEFALNDRFIPSVGQRKGFELLLRKLLLLPSQPAVVVVNWWAPRHDCTELISDPPPGALGKCSMSLWNTTEDSMQELVEHYGVQSISFRNAFWPEINAEAPGWRPDELFLPDMIHPSARGVRIFGGLVIDWLKNASAAAGEQGLGGHVTETQLVQPLYTDVEQDTAIAACSRGDSLQDKVMYNLNWDWVSGRKPGWESRTESASIFLAMDLPADPPPTHFSVGFLRSYEGTGMATVTCLGGCKCDQQNIEAHNPARPCSQMDDSCESLCKVSQEDFATFNFTLAEGGSSGCVLKFVNKRHALPAGDVAMHFKLTSVSVVTDPGLHCERGEAGIPLPCWRATA